MDLSGLRETISTRGKIFPERSRMVGSVNGKSIIVPRMGPSRAGRIWPHATTKPQPRGKARRMTEKGMRLPDSGQFLLQSGLISATMQRTAEATVSRLRWPGQPVCQRRKAVSSARSAPRTVGSGQRQYELTRFYIANLPLYAT